MHRQQKKEPDFSMAKQLHRKILRSGSEASSGSKSPASIGTRVASEIVDPKWNNYRVFDRSKLAQIPRGPLKRKNAKSIMLDIVAELLDTDKDGYLSTKDVENFIHIYELDETIEDFESFIDDDDFKSTTKDEFKRWVRYEDIDVLSIPSPVKLLRPVSNSIQSGCLDHSASNISTFMDAVFTRTFGNKVNWGLGMLGYNGVMEYLNNNRGDEQLSLKELETLARLWGLTAPQAKSVGDYAKSRGMRSTVSYQNVHAIFSWVQTREEFSFNLKEPRDPAELFSLLDRDNDGFVSPAELGEFAARFNQKLSKQGIKAILQKLDFDKDGRLGVEDFRRTMLPVLEGTKWDVWLVGIAFVFFLAAANPTPSDSRALSREDLKPWYLSVWLWIRYLCVYVFLKVFGKLFKSN